MRKSVLAIWLVCGLFIRASALDNPIYLMVAPNDLYDSLSWYIGERAKTHPEVEFAIVNTKTEIYDVADYDYRKSGSSRCRNAAESIHKYLRQYYKNHPNLKYVVLGGAWYDATNFRGMNPVYFRNDDTEVTLDNAIPGIFCPFLSTFGGNYPSDMFYGCLNEKGTYPWDANGDGQYMDEEECREKKVDVVPSVAVARLSFIPRPEIKDASGRMLNQHEMVTNYLHKLNRAERADFAGRAKYGAEGSWVNGSQPNSSGDMDRQEFEFYDFAPNMGDPRSSKTHGDEEAMSRRDLKNIAGKHPILQCKTLNDSTKTARGLSEANVSEDFFNSDMDYAWVYSHGWAMGGSYFSASAYTSHRGLHKFLNAAIPCDTGMIDYYEKANGKTYLHWCLGSSGLMSPNAGFLASVNNTRYGVEGESASNGLKKSLDLHFAHNHETAGEAWLNAILDQHRAHFTHASWMVQRNYAIAIFHGDPLVKIADDEDVTIAGETWDALQSVKDATITSSTLNVPTTVAMMSATLTADSNFTLTSDYEFRVMNTLTAPAGHALTLNAPGGVGKGVEFAEANDGNKLTLNSPAYFYLGGLKNAKELALTGKGAVVEADNLQDVESLSFNGSNRSGAPNILRSRTKGALKSYPSLALKSTALELQTWESFEGADEALNLALDDADLIVGQNPYWGLSGHSETLSGAMTLANGSKLKVKCTTEAVLDSLNITSTGNGNALESVDGGVFGLKGTTTITLDPGTTFTMVAEFKDLGSGKIVFLSPDATAENPAKVDFAQAKLAGAVELGENVRLADPTILTWSEADVGLVAGELLPNTKIFFPNMSESPWGVYVVGAIKLGPSFFANNATQYIFIDDSFMGEDTSITTDSLAIIGDTRFWLPLNLNKLVITGEFGCTVTVDCPDVVVEKDGKFRLEGEPKANIVLRDGAVLKAAIDDWEETPTSMTWNEGTTITWEGEVVVDVSEIKEFLTEEPITIVSGDAHAWTSTELASFRVVDEDVVLRIGENGELQVVQPRALKKGPYMRTISTPAAKWDTAEWDGFTEKWSESELDITASATLTIENSTTLTIDTDVALKAATFIGEGEEKVEVIGGGGEVEVVDIDFTALTGEVTLKDLTIVGNVHTPTKMTLESVRNATIVMHPEDELTIEDPLSCSLIFDPASQGVVYLRDASLKANKNELFHMSSAPMSGFEFFAVDEKGEVDRAVEIYYDEAAQMICSRPLGGLTANVSNGTASFTALNWKNSAGESVTVSDWSAVEEANLTVSGNATINLNAAPTLKLNISGSGTLTFRAVEDGGTLPTTLVVDGASVVVAGDILPRLDAVSGSGSLTLDTKARTEFPMTTAASPAKDLPNGITINEGSELVLVFSGNMSLWNTWSWDRLKGYGKLVFASNNGTKYRIYSPQNGWSQTLSFAHYVDVIYELNTVDVTYKFKNLEGEGKIGIQPGDTNSRATMYYEITQTRVSEWAGTGEYIRFAGNSTDSDHQFILKGTSSSDARLIYSGQCEIGQPFLDNSGNRFPDWAATWNHTFTVDATGVLELNGRWVGPLVNRGLVILGKNAELTMANGSDSLLTGRIAGFVDLTKSKVKFDSNWVYDVSEAGEIRFSVNDLEEPKAAICRVVGTLKRRAVKLIATDPSGNTATRMVMAADISSGYLNWRGPANKTKVLFK